MANLIDVKNAIDQYLLDAGTKYVEDISALNLKVLEEAFPLVKTLLENQQRAVTRLSRALRSLQE